MSSKTVLKTERPFMDRKERRLLISRAKYTFSFISSKNDSNHSGKKSDMKFLRTIS